jgi:hypothetical protein
VTGADTVNDVKAWLARAAMAGCGMLAALLAPAAAMAAGGAATQAHGAGRSVVLITIPGLRWTDITPAVTPVLWRLAADGSAGSLVAKTALTGSCPADSYLTLNSGASAQYRLPSGRCAPLPAVTPTAAAPASSTTSQNEAWPAHLAAMPRLVRYNEQFSTRPDWGLLATAAGPGQCATAVGPGGALALASQAGNVASYVPGAGTDARSAIRNCPLTVAGLGSLPPASARQGPAARARALRSADQAAERIIAAAPAGAIVVVAGLADGPVPHLQAIIVSGPGYSRGLLTAASTRRPGLVTITDLTVSVLRWRAQPRPAAAVGSPIMRTGRGPLAAAVRALIGQDTVVQVYRTTAGWFFLGYAAAEMLIVLVIALALRGGEVGRRRRRRTAYRVALVSAAAVSAGTVLAGLVPWPVLPHPALLLYGLGLGWSAVIAALALAGPWRRSPLGPPGFVSAVTVLVIALDVITGSHLQRDAPFGQAGLVGGRYYGIGNCALVSYAAGALIWAAWAALPALRAGRRSRAVATAGAIGLFAVVACGWPEFGAKVGGTMAMVPCFLLLLAAIGGARITAGRAMLIAVSGIAVIAAVAVLNYLFPAVTGSSDIGAFVGQVLHGSAGSILQRKASANAGSLTGTWFTPLVPAVVAVTGLMLARPGWFRLRTLARALAAQPLLRPLLTAVWLAGLLGWLADDSGVSVPAAGLPFALPLAIVIVTGIAGLEGADGMSGMATKDRTAARSRPGG